MNSYKNYERGIKKKMKMNFKIVLIFLCTAIPIVYVSENWERVKSYLLQVVGW